MELNRARSHEKELGVLLSANLRWKFMCKILCASQGNCCICNTKLKQLVRTHKDLLEINIFVIRTVLEYACPAWQPRLPK